MSSALAALAASQQSYGPEPAGAVDFDGTNDYLSRMTNLSGGTASATFTVSAWFYYTTAAVYAPVIYFKNSSTNAYIEVRINCDYATSQSLDCRIYSGTANQIAFYNSDSVFGPALDNTWCHILISLDNASNTVSAYLNDVAVNLTSWGSAGGSHSFDNYYVGRSLATSSNIPGRLAHVYVDYTYRVLSNVTNRRLFVTADLKPAQGQAALNPILYLPMTDPTTAHVNSGTGGNFTLTGTIARSGRGPNQFNVPYSDLDGAADYLTKTSITGIADGKQLTISWSGQIDADAGNCVFGIHTGATPRLYIYQGDGSKRFQIVLYNASGTTILNAYSATNVFAIGRNHTVQFSVDLSNTSKRHCYIDGQSVSLTYSPYTDDVIDFTSSNYDVGFYRNSSLYFNGRLGNVWFNTSYIDLSQPTNLAKFVTGTGIDAKPVDLGANGELPTGTSPLIYLPMYGNNAGKNYGTGGDFTVNSGPYTGARGPNEFWGNWATFSSGNYLSRAAVPTGIADGKTGSVSFWIKRGATTSRAEVFWSNGQKIYLAINYNANGELYFLAKNASSTTILQFNTAGGALSASATSHVLFCFDLTSSALRQLYINGASVTPTWGTYTNDTVDWTETNYQFNPTGGSWPFSDSLAEFYLSTSYIDFSQEANRLLFRDAFGNPTNLPAAIQAGTVPNPAIYMRFDPASFGTNSGTGGNFTVNGTITDGGQL